MSFDITCLCVCVRVCNFPCFIFCMLFIYMYTSSIWRNKSWNQTLKASNLFMTYILVFKAWSNSNDYYFTLELKLIFNLLNKKIVIMQLQMYSIETVYSGNNGTPISKFWNQLFLYPRPHDYYLSTLPTFKPYLVLLLTLNTLQFGSFFHLWIFQKCLIHQDMKWGYQ